MLPRFLRLRDAPVYLGMNIHLFNSEVRPYLTEIPIVIQGIAFDRLDLDKWAEQYKRYKGRSARLNGDSRWEDQEMLDSSNVGMSGILTSKSSVNALEKALAQVIELKRKRS